MAIAASCRYHEASCGANRSKWHRCRIPSTAIVPGARKRGRDERLKAVWGYRNESRRRAWREIRRWRRVIYRRPRRRRSKAGGWLYRRRPRLASAPSSPAALCCRPIAVMSARPRPICRKCRPAGIGGMARLTFFAEEICAAVPSPGGRCAHGATQHQAEQQPRRRHRRGVGWRRLLRGNRAARRRRLASMAAFVA